MVVQEPGEVVECLPMTDSNGCYAVTVKTKEGHQIATSTRRHGIGDIITFRKGHLKSWPKAAYGEHNYSIILPVAESQ